MTFDERMAELGVDPIIESLNENRCDALYEKFYEEAEATADALGIEFDAIMMITVLLRGIAERDDIIDRMETRIVNLTAERDYLIRRAPDVEIECDLCVHRECVDEPPCDECAPPPGESFFEFAGVPEDWRADE